MISANQRFHTHVKKLFVKPADPVGRAVHAAVGISGEAGEILDAIKKHWVYGAPLDLENIVEECGDCLFYIVALLDLYGVTVEDAMTANELKLEKRYPAGYTDAAAIERADKK